MSPQPFIYSATCDRVIDGDTIIAQVDLGFRVYIKIPIRVRGVNAPELHGATKEAGLAAKQYVTDLLAGKTLLVQSFKDDQSFARWVCDVWVDTSLLADLVINSGHGVKL